MLGLRVCGQRVSNESLQRVPGGNHRCVRRSSGAQRTKRTWCDRDQEAVTKCQGEIENVNRAINGVCRAMWLSLEDLLRENLTSDSTLVAWLIRDAAWSLTRYQVKNEGRTAFVRVLGPVYTGQVLLFGERVLYKYTAVPAGNLDQKWGHGTWEGKAPMRTST